MQIKITKQQAVCGKIREMLKEILTCCKALDDLNSDDQLGMMRLQVSDFLMRVKSGRFPSIEADMKLVLSHCGSLQLDAASIYQASK